MNEIVAEEKQLQNKDIFVEDKHLMTISAVKP
jgi:hypothetical protein